MFILQQLLKATNRPQDDLVQRTTFLLEKTVEIPSLWDLNPKPVSHSVVSFTPYLPVGLLEIKIYKPGDILRFYVPKIKIGAKM